MICPGLQAITIETMEEIQEGVAFLFSIIFLKMSVKIIANTDKNNESLPNNTEIR